MQVTETLSTGLKRGYAVTVPAADIEAQARAKLAEIGKTIRLPGFRPGKVPANIVRQRYGSSVMAEVMQTVVNGAADKVIEERKLRTAGQPRISLANEPDPQATAAQDLQINLEVDLLPDITIPDLSTISLVRLRAAPADHVVDHALEGIAASNRQFEPIEEDRGAETGEVVVADFTGTLDGVPFDGGSATDADLEIGGSGFIPGFTEQIEGIKPGETKVIDVTFPDDYHATELAGRTAQFSITAKALKRPLPAAVDDTLAERNGFETLAELREAVVGQFQRELDHLSRLHLKRALLDALAERADFPSPENLLEAEFSAIWRRVEQEIAAGRMDEDDRGKDEATLKAEYHAIADRRVRLGLLLSEIGIAQSITVSSQEISAALRAEAAKYPGQEQQVIQFFRSNPNAIEQLRGPIFEDKVVDYILTLAQVEEREVTPEELAEAGNLDISEGAGPATPDADVAPETAAHEPAQVDAEAGQAATEAT
jgi:trigger factor